MRNIKTSLTRGGTKFSVNPKEYLLLQLLLDATPMVVSYEKLRRICKCSQVHLRTMVEELRPMVTLEGGIIESVQKQGYRIGKFGAFK